MKILFIGDIVGSPGRKIVHDRLADIISQRGVDLCIANGENSASGFGITPRLAEEIFAAGAEVITGGNHSWDRKEIFDFLPHEPRLIRPANFPEGTPGKGHYVGQAKNGVPYAVLNLQGRTFMAPLEDPFRTAERELAALPPDVKVIVVDMHAIDGLVSRRPSFGRARNAHARHYRGQPRSTQGHRLHYRCRHDRAARFRYRHGKSTDRAALSGFDAQEIRGCGKRYSDEYGAD
jgi:hypothetical protein